MYTEDDIKAACVDHCAIDYESFKAGFEAGHRWYLDKLTAEREELREQNARARKLQREARDSPYYRKMT